MHHSCPSVAALAIGLALHCFVSVGAEQHRATRLGNPATRFAPPLVKPEDLRSLFRNNAMKPDIASILHQWGWAGDVEDLFQAALTNEITEVQIPVGTIMPFMSSRENGKPICLRNVRWAGQEPISAFAFNFASRGQRYRCVTPKPCSNFFLEDLGPEPRHGLVIECRAPAKILVRHPAEVCLTVRNIGNVSESLANVILPVPDGAELVSIADGGTSATERVTWEVTNLAPNGTRQVCATFKRQQPGMLTFNPTASSAAVAPVRSACVTQVAGVPGVLLEVVDLEDPIEVGKEVTYDIRVTNQGSANLTNVRLTCLLAPSQEFVSAKGTTLVHAEEGTLTVETTPTLSPKAQASWRVIVKAVKADDALFKVELHCDEFENAVREVESTQQY